jgi:hypothetical protein
VAPSMFDNQMRQQREDAQRKRERDDRDRQAMQSRSQATLQKRDEDLCRIQRVRDERLTRRHQEQLDAQARSMDRDARFADESRERSMQFQQRHSWDGGRWALPNLTPNPNESEFGELGPAVKWTVLAAIFGAGVVCVGWLFG